MCIRDRILLDGADTLILHAVLVNNPEMMQTGMRVSIKWKQQTEGHIQDIEGFVPEEENND